MKKRAFRQGEVPPPGYPSVSGLDRRSFLAGVGAALASAALAGEARADAPDAGVLQPPPPPAGAPVPEPPPARKGDVAVEHPRRKPAPPPPPRDDPAPPPKAGKVKVDHLDEPAKKKTKKLAK